LIKFDKDAGVRVFVERIKYQIITNGKVANTFIEDIDSSEHAVNAYQDPEDEIDAEAIVAQLQQGNNKNLRHLRRR
jgi:hypothetical protein